MSDNSVHINGGSVVAGSIGGSGHTVRMTDPKAISVSDTDQFNQALGSLRTELAEIRCALTAVGDSRADPQEVDDVIDLLPEQPDASIEPARGAWAQLMQRLPMSAINLESLTRIASLLEQIKGLTG